MTMWQHRPEDTAAGPTILLDNGATITALWSDQDGLRLTLDGPLEDLSTDQARDLARALLEAVEVPHP